MNTQQILSQSRQYVSEAETDKALALLESFLDGQQQFKPLQKDVLQISAQFSKTQQEEKAGLISFDNAKISFNQVNRQLLELLEDLEKGLSPLNPSNGWKPAVPTTIPVPDLSNVKFDHALRPEFTEHVIKVLFRQRQSVNLIGEKGMGVKRLLDDIQQCGLSNVCLVEVDMKNYVVSYDGFLEDLVGQLCPEFVSDRLNDLVLGAA
mgnify:FL=1